MAGMKRPRSAYRTATRRRRSLSLIAAVTLSALVIGRSPVANAAPAAHRASSEAQAPLTSALAAELSKNVNQHVIVILKSQPPAARLGSRAESARTAAIFRTQSPLRAELRAVHATGVKAYSLVSSIAATTRGGGMLITIITWARISGRFSHPSGWAP